MATKSDFAPITQRIYNAVVASQLAVDADYNTKVIKHETDGFIDKIEISSMGATCTAILRMTQEQVDPQLVISMPYQPDIYRCICVLEKPEIDSCLMTRIVNTITAVYR